MKFLEVDDSTCVLSRPFRSVHVSLLLKYHKGGTFYRTIFDQKSENYLSIREKWENDLTNFIHDDYWRKINKNCFIVTKDSKLRSFQFKLNNRILTTNDFVFKIGLSENRFCTFCNDYIETISHLFGSCTVVLNFFTNLLTHIHERCDVDVSFLTPFHFIFGYSFSDNFNLGLNKILLFARYFIYKSKCKNTRLLLFLFYLKSQFEIERKLLGKQSTFCLIKYGLNGEMSLFNVLYF